MVGLHVKGTLARFSNIVYMIVGGLAAGYLLISCYQETPLTKDL